MEKLIALIAILFLTYFFFVSQEGFRAVIDRDCSQRAINDGYLHYVFGGVKTTR
jgi:hypothetical protein